MPVNELIITSAVKIVSKIIENHLSSGNRKKMTEEIDLTEKLGTHLSYISNWSSRIQIYGLGEARNIEGDSICLNYHSTPRKFRGRDKKDEIKNEDVLISDKTHYILIGDPGAGKTTTLKRIARQLFKEDTSVETEIFQFPILIRLKDIKDYFSIYLILADIFGLIIESKTTKKIIKVPKKRLLESGEWEQLLVEKEITETAYYFGSEKIEVFIPELLNRSNALILIDGLDELNITYTDLIIKDLQDLALKLSGSKIIVTCRTGYYHTHKTIEGYNLLDILPLGIEQIRNLASLWIDDIEKFLKKLDDLPYGDLADRPLLLSQLLFIYKRYGVLPKSPKEIYQHIVDMLLKEWDADRQIIRKSKYADFNYNKKTEFLSELAFWLMYKDRKTKFDNDDLIKVYQKIHYKFDLPYEEAEDVASEIETITGIIVNSGFNEYEFSHLSLQEFFSAKYIVKSPITIDIKNFLEINPEPIAIAVALSSDPTGWFVNLVIHHEFFDVLKINMHAFISRLMIESPAFNIDVSLGYAILNVFWSNYKTADPSTQVILKRFFQIKAIKSSVELLLKESGPTAITRKQGTRDWYIIEASLPQASISGSSIKKSIFLKKGDLTEFFQMFDLKYKRYKKR